MNEDVQAEIQSRDRFLTRPVALTVAGFDPSSGAGITADIKVFAAHDIYGMACITALTVQSTLGVRRVKPVAPETIRETLACLLEDMVPDGVKIGMLATPEAVRETGRFLVKSGIDRQKVVLDPVIRSSSGRELLNAEGVAVLRSELLPLVGWITPNIDELAVLAGMEVAGKEAVPAAAARIQSIASSLHVLVTGGHFDLPDDFLLTSEKESYWLRGERVDTQSTHGTGCAFSSALLCRLIRRADPKQAAAEAKEYVTEALKAAYPVGKGKGPMHHFFGLPKF